MPPGGVAVEPDDHALGPSRGGLGTKVHRACEQGQRPPALLVTAGQRGDSPQFANVLNTVRGPGSGRAGRAVATRYDKRADRYQATVTIAAIGEWLAQRLS